MNKSILQDISEGPLWVFSADRRLDESELKPIQDTINGFLKSWMAHGQPVVADFQILDNTVILVAADQNKCDVTGCSKDKLNHLFLQMGNHLQVNFFNRMLIPVLHEERVELVHWKDIEDSLNNGTLSTDSRYLDGSIHSIAEFRRSGLKPLKEILVHP